MTQPQTPQMPPVDPPVWHYVAGTQQLGPVTLSMLVGMIQTRGIHQSTLVWRQGMAGWVPAGTVPELSYAFSSTGFSGAAAPVPGAKSKLAAGLLGILLGGLGVHRFYLGYIGIGVAQIAVSIITCGIGGLWGFIEGILILTGSGLTTDAQGRPLGE